MSKVRWTTRDFVAGEKAKLGKKPAYNDQYRFSRKTSGSEINLPTCANLSMEPKQCSIPFPAVKGRVFYV